MNVDQAKRIPLRQLLTQLGHKPVRENGDVLWYASPLRRESDASFNVSRRKNLWYDFGEGTGGSTIDLVMAVYGLTSVADALKQIDQLMIGNRSVEVDIADGIATSPSIRISRIEPLASRSLTGYLRQRGIDLTRASSFIREVHYTTQDKDYFAIGFANDSGGFELRNPYFKGSTSKDITTIEGDSNRVICFEGFVDFLTALTMFGGRLNGTAIVLNSASMKHKAVARIKTLNPSLVELYFDNDKTGKELVSYFRHALSDATIVDWLSLYEGHKDLNDWHAAHHVNTRISHI